MRGIWGEGGREGVNESRWRREGGKVKTFFVVGGVCGLFLCVWAAQIWRFVGEEHL